MRYPTDLPTADPAELSAAFASDDPLAYIDQHVAAIDRINRWAEAENAKWQRARSAVEVFSPAVEPPLESPDDTPAGHVDAKPASNDNGRPQLNGAGLRPKTRRAALLILFREHPNREWRTRELAAELERRGWAGPSGNEANKVSRSLAAMV